jgi:hypothetical protein
VPFPQANLPGHDIVWTIQGVEQGRLTTGNFLSLPTVASMLALAGDINIPTGSIYRQNTLPVFGSDGTYNRVYTAAGVASIQISVTDSYNDNNTHHWRTASGGANIANLDNTIGLAFQTAGIGFRIKEGSNARMGVSTLSSGTVVVSNNTVTANTRIFLAHQSLGTITVPVAVAVSARSAGVSFTILSGNLVDTSVIAWLLVEPA